MKENNEFYQMFKFLNYLDIIFGLALCMLVEIINESYLIISLTGFLIAALSFYINGYVVKYAFSSNNFNSRAIIMVSFSIRVILISILGLVLYTFNKFNIIAYMFGFSFRFFTLLMYGLIIKK